MCELRQSDKVMETKNSKMEEATHFLKTCVSSDMWSGLRPFVMFPGLSLPLTFLLSQIKN